MRHPTPEERETIFKELGLNPGPLLLQKTSLAQNHGSLNSLFPFTVFYIAIYKLFFQNSVGIWDFFINWLNKKIKYLKNYNQKII